MNDANMKKEAVVKRPQRWDEPLSTSMDETLVELVMASSHFKKMEPANFPASIALHDIIKNDCRIISYSRDQLMVRSKAYLNSAFILLAGSAVMVTSPEAVSNPWGVEKPAKPTVGSSLWRWLTRSKSAEVRRHVSAQPRPADEQSGHSTNPIIGNFASLTKANGVVTRPLVEGDMYGESAVLGRNEMSATVVALSAAIVLEIRWQGLRELRKREPQFREFVDQLYRERGLYDHLLSVPLLKHIPSTKIRELSKIALFEKHGEFEWHREFQTATKKSKSDENVDHLIESEPIIVEEGCYPDGLLLIRNGFGRVSRQVNHGQYTLGHLGAGDLFGLEELRDSWMNKRAAPMSCSLRALGYLDVIRIPTAWLEEHVFAAPDPNVARSLDESLRLGVERNIGMDLKESRPINRKFTEFVVENRYINGSQAMLIDLERCVRCDDCVTACANAHDNNPRFNRHGPRFEKYMIANACMHCDDPVCMIGCPTGAIHRAEDGVVSINDATCIGCSTCANSCPYDNIRMVPVSNDDGQPFMDEKNIPIVKATKCDLCSQVAGGPACERACSHDAITRIDLKDISKLADWVDR